MPAIRIELTNKKFGKLKALKYLGNKKWQCVCECGEQKIATSEHLRKGKTTHCGCSRKTKKIDIFGNNLSYEDLSKITGLSINTIKSRAMDRRDLLTGKPL